MRNLLARLATLVGLAAIGWSLLTPPSAVHGSAPPRLVYLPVIYGAPPATPTLAPSPTPAGCPSTGQSFGSLKIVGSPLGMPAAQDPDINLDLRGWATAPGNPPLSLVTYNGTPDPNAPQLSALLGGLPPFTGAYDVYNWNWASGSRGSLDTMWPVTLLGMGTSAGQLVSVPTSGYSIGQGYEALVLYATSDQITLTFTGYDSIVSGYALHVESVCVDPNLQALYNQLNAAGRTVLPALKSAQPFGRANGAEIQVAIRDTGTFMDPRSQTDWWKGY